MVSGCYLMSGVVAEECETVAHLDYDLGNRHLNWVTVFTPWLCRYDPLMS